MHWNAEIELNGTLTGDQIDDVLDGLAGFGPVVAGGQWGRDTVILTLPADSLELAARTALTMVERVSPLPAFGIEVIPTDEFDRRNGLEPVPELLTVEEAAKVIGVSRQRVQNFVDEGRLQHRKVGSRAVISRADAERFAAKERSGGRPKKA